jgi:hypothetical protein
MARKSIQITPLMIDRNFGIVLSMGLSHWINFIPRCSFMLIEIHRFSKSEHHLITPTHFKYDRFRH